MAETKTRGGFPGRTLMVIFVKTVKNLKEYLQNL